MKADSHDASSGSVPRSGATADAINPPDEVWAERGRAGDRRSLEELVRRHHEAVRRLLWRFARSPEDLDDLVQETFLRMVRGIPSWRQQQPFRHWLLRIATNVGRDYFRRRTVRQRWHADAADAEPGQPAPDPPDPAGDPAARQAANEIKATLDRLPPDDRTVLTLQHLEGWSLRDIAQHLGWTVTATKLRAWRARRRLRALLDSSPS